MGAHTSGVVQNTVETVPAVVLKTLINQLSHEAFLTSLEDPKVNDIAKTTKLALYVRLQHLLAEAPTPSDIIEDADVDDPEVSFSAIRQDLERSCRTNWLARFGYPWNMAQTRPQGVTMAWAIEDCCIYDLELQKLHADSFDPIKYITDRTRGSFIPRSAMDYFTTSLLSKVHDEDQNISKKWKTIYGAYVAPADAFKIPVSYRIDYQLKMASVGYDESSHLTMLYYNLCAYKLTDSSMRDWVHVESQA